MVRAKTLEDLSNLFDEIDKNKDGKLNREEANQLIIDLVQAICRQNYGINGWVFQDSKEVKALFNQVWNLADVNKDDSISSEEFKKILIPLVAVSLPNVDVSEEEMLKMGINRAALEAGYKKLEEKKKTE